MIAALSLATDLGIAVPLEHGLQSTLLAMRLADRLKVDAETAVQTYYACQLFYIGCTANADVPAELFGADDALAMPASPSRFGSRAEMTAGFFRAVAPLSSTPITRARQLARGVPALAKVVKHHIAEFCGWPGCSPIGSASFRPWVCSHTSPSGGTARVSQGVRGGDGLPSNEDCSRSSRRRLPADARWRRCTASVVRRRAGHAFDPEVAAALAGEGTGFLAMDTASAWEETLACEPRPHLLEVARSTAPLPRWATLLILFRRASSDTPPVSRGWLWMQPDAAVSTWPTSRRFGVRHLSTTSGG